MYNWKAIAAMSENGVIGMNNSLPWSIPAETQWFRHITKKELLVMGRTTFDSIKMRDKESIYAVLTKNEENIQAWENVIYLKEIEKINEIKTDKQIWICGGAQVYKQTIQNCSELYLTTIKKHYDGDCYFPPFEDYFILKDIICENELFVIKRYINRAAKELVE